VIPESDKSRTIPEPPSDRAAAGRITLRDAAQVIFFALVIKPFLRLFIGLRVRGRDNLPATSPFLLVANHSSHLDTVSILSLFNLHRLRTIRPVAAADYFERNRLIGFVSKAFFNILPIARKNLTPENNPLRAMIEALDAGYSLVVFPEGTRGSGEEIGQFRSGVAHLLEKKPGLPVVPVYLVNMGRSLPKGEFIPVPFFCEIRLGAPRVMEGTRAEITQALKEAVLELKNLTG
jgi:1-acyl-sn-glycerol-3-phosphate acyltransferase